LRAVLIQLARHIRVNNQKIDSIVSRAINPISIYLLAKYFHARNDKLEEYMKENHLTYSKLIFEQVKEFYDNIDNIDEMDFENEEDAANYFKNNKDFGNPVVLTIDLHDINAIHQAKKIQNDVVEKLKCPYDNKEEKNRKTSKKRKASKSKSKSRNSTYKIKNNRKYNSI
jgi:hypothetical protein